jgi:mannose-1-phosphate guanylyltransferase
MIMEQTTTTIATRPESRPPTATHQRGAPAHVLVLAGGDGLRALPVTRALFGDDRPKQFCALVGREPLVVQAQRRASLVVPPSRSLLVLTRVHEPYYRGLVYGTPASSLVVQPSNRGTGAAVLYGLLRIARKTPNAPVVILPSDHWVSDEAVFMAHVAAAIGIVRAHPTAVILLGVEPTRPEREYGWIEPSTPIADVWSDLHGVARFVEKPDSARALQMQQSGTSYWNTSVVAGTAEGLLFLFAMARPALLDTFLGVWSELGTPSETAAIERLYGDLPRSDFSADVLASQPESLSVLAVSGVAWEDVGSPGRMLAARRRTSSPAHRLPSSAAS